MSKNYKPFFHKNRSRDSESVGDAMKKMFKHFGLEEKLQSTRIVSVWTETMGKFIDERTKSVWLKNNVLHISLTSAALKNEMKMNHANIIKMINEALGSETVTSLKIY